MLIKVISRKLVQLIGYGNDNKDHSRKNSIPRLPPPVYIKTQRNIISMPLCWTTVLSNYNKQHNINNRQCTVFQRTKNGDREITLQNVNKTLPLAQLTRQLMNRENQPAIFYVNLFTTQDPSRGCFNLMDLAQSLLCDHYNITTFNLRNAICRRLDKNGD